MNEIEVMDACARGEGTLLAVVLSSTGGHMYWIMVVVMAGIGLGWVMVRRRRKATEKVA